MRLSATEVHLDTCQRPGEAERLRGRVVGPECRGDREIGFLRRLRPSGDQGLGSLRTASRRNVQAVQFGKRRCEHEPIDRAAVRRHRLDAARPRDPCQPDPASTVNRRPPQGHAPTERSAGPRSTVRPFAEARMPSNPSLRVGSPHLGTRTAMRSTCGGAASSTAPVRRSTRTFKPSNREPAKTAAPRPPVMPSGKKPSGSAMTSGPTEDRAGTPAACSLVTSEHAARSAAASMDGAIGSTTRCVRRVNHEAGLEAPSAAVDASRDGPTKSAYGPTSCADRARAPACARSDITSPPALVAVAWSQSTSPGPPSRRTSG